MRKFALLSVLALGFAVMQASAFDKAPAAPEAKPVAVKAEGQTRCGHCNFGIEEGDGCSLAVETKDGKVFVLQGEGADFAKLFKARFSKTPVKFEGTKVAEKKNDKTAYTLVKVTKIEEVKQ